MLFDAVEELDAVGPWEMFGMWASRHPGEAELVAFGPRAGTVRGAKGLGLVADRSIADVGHLDVVVHPGGVGTRSLLSDSEHLGWLRRSRDQGTLMTSVCTGSLVYAAAGLLTGRRATTHWASLDRLAEIDPSVVVDRRARFVDDGTVVTSAGVSAGIDLTLHLIARLAGVERAREIRRGTQYDPDPPV
jgi:transcriptional regulator GlxA family with amidase domain